MFSITGLSWNHGGHVWGHDPPTSQTSATQLSLLRNNHLVKWLWTLNILATSILGGPDITFLRASPSCVSAKVSFVQLTLGWCRSGKLPQVYKASRNLHGGGSGYLPPKFTNVINERKMKILLKINAVREDVACYCWTSAADRTIYSLKSWTCLARTEWLITLELAILWPRSPCH